MKIADRLVKKYQDQIQRARSLHRPPPIGRSIEPESPLVADTVDNSRYSVKFLVFVYGLPFRKIALLQELNDIFGFDPNLCQPPADFDSWDLAQRRAFECTLLEYRRLCLLQEHFDRCERQLEGQALSNDERTSFFIEAHENAVRMWSQESNLSDMDLPRNIGPSQLTLPLGLPAQSAQKDERKYGGLRLPKDLPADQLSPHEVSAAVLDKLAATEVLEAERRFALRVRWLISLTTQKRTATIYRILGRRRKEIASVMGISDESVKTYLARANREWETFADQTDSGYRRVGNQLVG